MDKYNGINSVTKIKRKELEEVNDDFSEFSLSSPARKIRRLDVELPPIVEEEDTDLPMEYEQVIPENVISNGVGNQLYMPDIEEVLAFVPENEERAIVLFKPMKESLSCPGSNFSIDPKLIATFKNQALWGMNLNASEHSEKDEDSTDGDSLEASACRAVIPWVPTQQPFLKPEVPGFQTGPLDTMDTEEPEVTTMEIEESGFPNFGQQTSEYYHLSRLSSLQPHFITTTSRKHHNTSCVVPVRP